MGAPSSSTGFADGDVAFVLTRDRLEVRRPASWQ
jgi:hypothetical protein